MSKKIYQAVGLTFVLSWGLALIVKLLGFNYLGTPGLILAILYMFTPALAAFILSRFVWKVKISEWGIRWPKGKKWFLLAWFWPIALGFAVIPVALLMPGVSFAPGMEGILARFAASLPPDQLARAQEQVTSFGPFMILILIFQSLAAGITINAVASFGEELMWRGLLLKELKDYGWLKASLIIGTIWGVWHAPLIIQGHNYPQHPYIGVFMMIIWCILLTPSLVYFAVRTRSVLTAAVVHGTINASYGIGIAWIMGGNDLTIGLTGLAGFITLTIFNLALIAYNKKSKVKADDLLNNY